MTAHKRKLVCEDILRDISEKFSMGVPLTRLIRQHNIDVSLPHMAKLLSYYEANEDQELIHASLFPDWLGKAGVQPDGWYYEGSFPYGEWVQSE